MSAPRHGAIVLAAGASRRLGMAKALLAHRGSSLLEHALSAVLATRPLDTVLVAGAVPDLAVRELARGVRGVVCADWDEGLAASLRCGLRALDARCAGALIAICDQPAIDAAHLRRLVAAWRRRPDAAVASRYAGVRGVPALVPRAWFAALDALHGDVGARELLRTRGDVHDVVNEALADDVDRIDDLERLRRGAR
jgi:CTP:molybdopterin cytidylyltransferase MocA